jgi:hypothetical protein
MDQFDIIGALESFAIGLGWEFYYTFDDFYSNIGMTRQWDNDQLVLIADFQALPTIVNGKIPAIVYTCLLMLGRKSETAGTISSMDETPKQKYENRLKDLMQTLSTQMGAFACDNELEITNFPMVVEINQFDENLDFATALNATFLQE